MSQHTPGPWEVVQHSHVDGELWLSVNQSADAQGMKEWIAEIKYLMTDPKTQRANARLIAAAPDLYEIARLVVAICDSGDTNAARLACMENSPLVGSARSAIAKAEGA